MLRVATVVPSLLLLGLTAYAQEEPVTFGFEKTDGEHWLRSSEHVDIRDVSGSDGITETMTIQEVDELYEKTDGAWTVVRTPRKAELWVNGIDTQNQAISITVGIPITVTLDDNGLGLEATGFRKLMRKLEDELPPDQFGRVRQNYDVQRLERTEVATWNDALGDFAGHTVKVGERWRYSDKIVVAGQSFDVFGVIRFDGWTEMDGIRGFKILIDYDNHGGVLRELGEGTTRSVGAGSTQETTRSNLELEGSDIRVVDPVTGQMIYRSREYSFSLSNPLEGDVPGATGHIENRTVERWSRVDS